MCLLRLLAFKPLTSRQVIPPDQPVQTLEHNAPSMNFEAPHALANVDKMTTDPAQLANDTGQDALPESKPNSLPVGIAPVADSQMDEMANVELVSTETVTVEVLANEALAETPSQQVTVTLSTQVNPEDLSQPTLDPAADSQSTDNLEKKSNAPLAPIANQSPVMKGNSPLDLLQPPPQPLVGEWTVEKWDYWVAQARENGWLAEDELVLAKLGVMQGQIGAASRFVTDEKIFSHSQTFLHLQQKIQRQLTGTTVTLETLTTHSQFIVANKPESLQKQRDSHALAVATEQMRQQPVMQALLQQNASISVVKFNSD